MIYYFSGNGNTRYAALELSRLLDIPVHEFSPDELLHPENVELHASAKCVIWAFPTYSWGIPPVIATLMEKAKLDDSMTAAIHTMLTTCGDDMGYTDRQWRRLMHRRGLRTAGAYAVIMPNTYTLMKGFDVDSREVAREKLSAAPARLEAIAADIRSSIESTEAGELSFSDMPVRLGWSWVKTNIVYPWFVRYAMSPHPFHSTEGCISCGRCARECPMANITMVDERPQWAAHCAMCLRCYHVCPRHAVAYGNATGTKGQYICPLK